MIKKRIKQSTDFERGEESVIDSFTYSGLEENPDYLIIDGQYIRCIYISGYPFVANSGWLDSLISFKYDNDISYHIHEISALLALPKLHRKITELESTKRAMMREGKIIGSEVTDPLESAIDLREKILRGQEKLFQISIYICLRAQSLQELDRITTLLESTMAARLFLTKTARYQQIEALQAILPRVDDQLGQKRNLDSSSMALSFPFMSSEIADPNGILYGINQSNDSLVIIDRFNLPNANSIVFAQSGSGKSYLTKVEILRQLIDGVQVIVIDPEREYQRLSQSVKGTYIKLSSKSKEHINPFERNALGKSADQLSEHVQDLTSIISLMADGLNAREKAVIDKTIMKILKSVTKKVPTLATLFNELKKTNQEKLCDRLEKYINGSLAEVFNKPTNINLSNRLIVFDIKDLPESLRQIMMLIIANFVGNTVKSNPAKRLLIIDEAWMLLEHETSAKFISGLVRRARKYYLGVSIISQQANDFLNSRYGKAIASQSSFRILMRQDSTTIKNVVSEFNLSEYEKNYLLNCERGDSLMIVDQNHVAVRVIASDKEHPLITTDPSELYEREPK
jgi:type IV secretory pathway VirB4 component